jgi:hypothetical protein
MLFEPCKECKRPVSEKEADVSRTLTESTFGGKAVLCIECRNRLFVRGGEIGLNKFDMV